MDQRIQIRPLVLGAGGLVGSQLAESLERVFPNTISATRAELDITDRWRLEAEIERLEPTVVVNAAALSNVDFCEKEPELAEQINAHAPRAIAEICRNAGIRMIHFSTDYVFDGEKGGEYDEADPPNPLSEYGRSKLLGEMGVLETLADSVVLRVSFVFGPGRHTFFDAMVEKARSGREPVPVLETWTSRPTHTGEICSGVERVLNSEVSGLLHLACPPAVNRAAFARKVFELVGADPGRVVQLASEALDLPARRPGASALSTRRFESKFGPVIRDWHEWAREYLSVETGDLS